MSRNKNGPHDVAIVGGGIAGCLAAHELASKGLDTILFEKERAPHHKVCGEFMSREGATLIENSGIDLLRLGAVPINGFRLHGPFRTIEAKLPQPALGISRYVLDEQLLVAAEKAGAEVRRGSLVQGIAHPEDKNEIVLTTDMGEERASRLIVASGKFDLRSVQKRVGRDSGYVGFKQHLKLRPSLAGQMRHSIDLFVFKHGYGGLSPIEDGKFNFCFVIEKSALRKIGSDWDSLTYHIARHNWEASQYLDGAVTLLKNPVTVASIPYGFVRAERPEPGMFFVGDQMAVIPSLTGDGMSIAAMTGVEAARAIFDPKAKKHLSPARTSAFSYQRSMRARLKKQVEMGYRLHRLFKNPHVLDLATYAVKPFPRAIDFIFSRTRCQVPKTVRSRVAAAFGRRLTSV